MCGILGVAVKKWSMGVVRNLFDIFDHQSGRGVNGAGISINSAEGLWRFRSYSPYRIFAAYNATIWESVKSGDRILFHHRIPTSTENAPRFNHPFENEDKTLHLIHNGIIANDRELFARLKSRHTFETLDGDKFTDSEVLVHLFEDEYAKDKDVVKALIRTSETATGSFTFAMQRKGDDCIYLVKHSNPLVISKDDDNNFYFSSILDKSNGNLKDVYEVCDSEIIRLTSKGYEKVGKFNAPYVKWVYTYDSAKDSKKDKKKHKSKDLTLDDIQDYDEGLRSFSWKPNHWGW